MTGCVGGTRVVIVLFAVLLLQAGETKAEDVKGYAELVATTFRVESGIPGLPGIVTDTDALLQRYYVEWDRRIYPNLRLRLGGVFERIDSESQTVDLITDSATSRLQPFFDIQLNNRIHLAQFRYNRNENLFENVGFDTDKDIQETYWGILGWFPERLPWFRFEYRKTNRFDDDREQLDLTEDRIQILSEYRPFEPLQFFYRGTITDTDNKLDKTDLQTTINSGRVTYTDSYIDRRIFLNADYNITHFKTESGSQSVVPVGGLSANDDTPELGALEPNPALVDENLTASAGINLGLPPPGGDDRPRNMGLDFGSPGEFNQMFVWIDRELPSGIAGSFTWTIYVSDDNDVWVRWQEVGPGFFDPFLQRYQFEFSNATARYVKAVTSPLSPIDPNAINYPEIYVTEVQVNLKGSEIGRQRTQTTQIAGLDMRARLLEAPSLYYEFTYSLRDAGFSNWTVTNGISLTQPLGEVYVVAARLTREDGRDATGDRSTWRYTASLAASAIRTLTHSLVVSGAHGEQGLVDRDSDSVYLYNTATIYPGADVTLGIGKTFIRTDFGTSEVLEVNANTNLIPHRTVNINLTYSGRDEDRVLTDGTGVPRFARSGVVSLAYNPLQTIYLFGSHRIDERDDIPRRTINNFSINWAPFPEGALQLSIRYNEVYFSEDDQLERSLTPFARWNFNRRSYLELTYQRLTSNSMVRDFEDNLFSGTLRLGF